MKFKIRLRDEVTIKEVEGYKFRVGRFHFFMVKNKHSLWDVSEFKTGGLFNTCIPGYSTRKEAIEVTKESVLRIGDAEFQEVRDLYIQRFGVLNV